MPSGIMETGSVYHRARRSKVSAFSDKTSTNMGHPDRAEKFDATPSEGHHHSRLHSEARSAAYSSSGRDYYSFNGGQKTWDATGPNDAIAPLPGETHMLRFDNHKGPTELAKDKRVGLIDKTSPEGDRAFETRPESDKSTPKITVGMQDLQNPDAVKPHFVVKKDGSVEMRGDPEKLNSKDINIVLEREPGDLNPTAKQKRAADELVRYLSDRIRSKYPDAAKTGVELNDKDDAVSAATERANKLRPPAAEQNMTPQTRAAVGQANRMNGTDGVNMPRESTDRMGSFNTRQVDRQPGETDRTAAEKEAIAGLFKPDERAPYETVRRNPDNSIRAGRYGFSGRQINSWLAGLDLGDPPDPAKIEQLIKDGKLPKGFNADSVGKLKDMANKMDQGQAPGKDDMKSLMPKDMQERMASSLTDGFKQQLGDNPGAITAAFMSGKAPGEITQADLSTPEARQLMTAGQQLFDVASQRQQSSSSNGDRVVGTVPTGQRAELIQQALSEINRAADQGNGKHVEPSPANLAAINLIIQRESSWKADITNNWDSNARKGTPSKGLMQTIGPTFDANKLPGHNNILDPVDNIIAGVRYAVKRYGSIENVPGVRAVSRGQAYRGY